MTSRSRIVRSSAFLCGCLLLVAPTPPAHCAQRAREPITFALAFLRATYPEVSSQQWAFRVVGSGTLAFGIKHFSFGVQMHIGEPLEIVTEADETTIPGFARFRLDEFGDLHSVMVTGRVANTAQNHRLTDVVTQRRDWTNAEVRGELKRQGALYVDDATTLIKNIPIAEWSPLFGELRLVDQQLNMPQPGPEPGKGRTDFSVYWELLFGTEQPEKLLYVRAEPFGGRVLWVARVDKRFKLKSA